MFTLGLVCIFVSFILVIMGLLAWGSMTSHKPVQEQPPIQKATESQATDEGEIK